MMETTEKTAKSTLHFLEHYDTISPIPENQNTTTKAFLTTARAMPKHIAMRKKRFGIWQDYTWEQSLEIMREAALGLMSLGLVRGEKVCLIGENDPEFYWAEYAVHAVGATSIAIFGDANLQELTYIANQSDSVLLFAHDQEQVDKALDLREQLPNIRKVIYWDDRGLFNYNDEWLMSFAALRALGREFGKANPAAFEASVAKGQPDDMAIYSYTSGTSGVPKGAMVSHANLLYATWHTRETVPVLPTDEYVSFSPLAWITEQGLGIGGHAMNGTTINFPEGPMTVQHDLREIAPSSLLFPSRVWEGLARTMQMRVDDSFAINRMLFNFFLPIAYKVIDLEDARQPIPWHLKALRALGRVAVLGPLCDRIGMTRMRHAFTSGASLSPSVLRYFRAVGVELKSIYGSTEVQGATQHITGNVELASVGQPIPGVMLKIAEDGEIRVKSRSVFKGYYKMPDKTAEAFDEEGFFKTGDAGYVDADGQLIYLDRVKDMIRLKNGERFSPQYIEGRLKFNQFVQDVMAIGGDDKDFVTAIVIIDFENVSRWAEKNRVHFTTYVDLTQKPEIYAQMRDAIEEVNETLPPSARIRKFVILHKAFDADEAELTRTRKLRRSALEERYGDMIDAMYQDKDSVMVVAEVKYRDGRTGSVETEIRVAEV